MNLTSLLILIGVAAAAVFALVRIIRDRKRCKSGCESCSLRENCKKL